MEYYSQGQVMIGHHNSFSEPLSTSAPSTTWYVIQPTTGNQGSQEFYAQDGQSYSQDGLSYQQADATHGHDGVSYVQAESSLQQGGMSYSQDGVSYVQTETVYQQDGLTYNQDGVTYSQEGQMYAQEGQTYVQGQAYVQDGVMYSQDGSPCPQDALVYAQDGQLYTQDGQLVQGEITYVQQDGQLYAAQEQCIQDDTQQLIYYVQDAGGMSGPQDSSGVFELEQEYGAMPNDLGMSGLLIAGSLEDDLYDQMCLPPVSQSASPSPAAFSDAASASSFSSLPAPQSNSFSQSPPKFSAAFNGRALQSGRSFQTRPRAAERKGQQGGAIRRSSTGTCGRSDSSLQVSSDAAFTSSAALICQGGNNSAEGTFQTSLSDSSVVLQTYGKVRRPANKQSHATSSGQTRYQSPNHQSSTNHRLPPGLPSAPGGLMRSSSHLPSYVSRDSSSAPIPLSAASPAPRPRGYAHKHVPHQRNSDSSIPLSGGATSSSPSSMSPNLMRQNGSTQEGEDLYSLVPRASRRGGFPRSASLTVTTSEGRRDAVLHIPVSAVTTFAAASSGKKKLIPKSASTGSSPTPAMRESALRRESPRRLTRGMAHVKDATGGVASPSPPPVKQVRFSDMIELAEFIPDDPVDSDDEDEGTRSEGERKEGNEEDEEEEEGEEGVEEEGGEKSECESPGCLIIECNPSPKSTPGSQEQK